MHALARLLTGALVALALAPAAAAAPPDPRWWAPNATLLATPAPPGAGPANADFARALAGWTLVGAGHVSGRTGGPGGHYAAIRDNTTLVSSPWRVPATAQVMTLDVRTIYGRGALRVLARQPARPDVLLGVLEPGPSWGRRALNAAPVAGRRVQLVLDPVIPFTEGIDVAHVGRTEQVAPGYALTRGAARRLAGGPGGRTLLAEPGPFTLVGARFTVPRDAVTLSLWLRHLTGAAPSTVVLEAGGVRLGAARAGARFAPYRFGAAALRGKPVALAVRAERADGLQLAWIGTVQVAPALRVGQPRRRPQGKLRLPLRASTALAGQLVLLEIRRPAGWRTLRRVVFDAEGKAAVLVPAPAKRRAVRLRWAGSERVAPGRSPERRLPAAPRPAKT